MIDRQRLLDKAAAYGLQIEPIIDKLAQYATLLVEYNKKVNLTAITDAVGIEDKHFIDCLLLAARGEVQGSLVDVGTGAGFPGIVIKLYKPDVELTLMEPTGKRVEFLRYACAELGIEAELIKERAEEAARKRWREQFDVTTARAVASMQALAEYCLPLVKPGGIMLAMKGSSGAEELAQAQAAIAKLGGKAQPVCAFSLPDTSERTLLICKKISQTPPQYPRNGGKIAKSPLA